MINIPIALFVIFIILSFVGAIVVLAWLLGLFVAIKSLIQIKKEDTKEIECPYFVESNNEK